jgi:hypothetical protein
MPSPPGFVMWWVECRACGEQWRVELPRKEHPDEYEDSCEACGQDDSFNYEIADD